MDHEPGQLAYETRFSGFTLGQQGIAPPWSDLPEAARAIWRRTEEAVERRVRDRLHAAVENWLDEVRTRP